MANTTLEVVVRHVHRVAAELHREHCTDAELLRQLTHDRDESAFAAVVRRHGPMVMRVCRHVLHQEQDAEDAFQVTFLVLARDPGAVRKGASLASWLHGVAYRTSLAARRNAATRRRHEARAEAMTKRKAGPELEWREVQAILEEEVQALPERYRTPFILCQMEGRSRVETARELGIKEGTLSSRLSRAQQRLRERLTARGVALAAVLGLLAVTDAGATVPRRLLDLTIRSGTAQAAGDLATAASSARVEALLRAMTGTLGSMRGKVATGLLAAVLVLAGVGIVSDGPQGQQGARAAAQDRPPSSAARRSPAELRARPRPVPAAKDGDDAVTVSGQVLGPEGKPVAGAEVGVRWGWNTELPAEPGIKTTSGPDGRFHLRFTRSDVSKPPLPPHTDPYQFAGLQVVAAARGYGPGWTQIVRGARGEGLTLRLVKDDVPITGRIRDIQLRPVTDATVRVLWAGTDGWLFDPFPGLTRGVKTDREGRFVLTGVGRDRKVKLAISGPTIEYRTVEVSTEKASAATVEMIARPTRVLEGTVRADDTGKPLAGVVIRGGPRQGRYSGIYTFTDAQGHYRLAGLPKGGSYEVTAWPNGDQPFLPRRATVGDSKGLKPITVDFRLQRGVVVRVRLVDRATGKPVRGMIHYDPLASNPSRAALVSNGAGFTPIWQYHTCYPDTSCTCRFVVPPGPGVVLGKGHDIPYLTRSLDPADEKAYPFLKKTPVFSGGIFHYWELFESYRVFDAKAGARPLDIDIDMDPGCKVEGKLVGPDGKPVTAAVGVGLTHQPQNQNNVSYRNDPAYRAMLESQTLATDRFVTAGLPTGGARTLTFLHSGRKLIANVVAQVKGKVPLTVRMEPWGAVTGRLVDATGKPLSGVTIELLYPSQDAPALLTPGTGGVAPGLLAPGWPFRTDAQGRFRVEGLIPGQKHRLTFPGGKMKEVSARAGEVRDLGNISVSERPARANEKGGQR